MRLTASVAFRRVLEHSPEVYLRWMAWRTDHPNPLRDDSELLVDGFPSSANSYTRSWIHFANPEARIASHQHSSAVVRAAVRRGVPVVVPFREPTETVVSMLTRFPRYRQAPPHGADRLFQWYVRYHRAVLAVADGVVLVPFERATSDLTLTVDELNRRFGTSFATLAPEHWPKVLAYLRTKEEVNDDHVTRVSAPSEAKEAEKQRYRAEVLGGGAARHRAAATRVHEELTSRSTG